MPELETAADTLQPKPLATNCPSVAPVQRQSVPPPPTRQPPPTGPLPPLPLPPGARPPAKPSMDILRMDFAPSQGEGEVWAPPLNAHWSPPQSPEAPPKSVSPVKIARGERDKQLRPPPEARSAQQKNAIDSNLPAPTSLFKRLSRSLGSARSNPTLRTNPASQSAGPDPTTNELGALEPAGSDVKRGLTNLVPRARASITARNAAAEAQRAAASDARRAAALRATGLLPASRRYSVAVHQDVDVNENNNDEGALAGRLERRRSRQGVRVPEPKQRLSEDGESEGDESAAARIARAWKTRYETSPTGTGAGSGEIDTAVAASVNENESLEPESVVSAGAASQSLVSDPPQDIAGSILPPAISPEAAAALSQRSALATWSFPEPPEAESISSSDNNLDEKEAESEGKNQSKVVDVDVGMKNIQEPTRDQGLEHGNEQARSTLGLGLHVPPPPPPPPKDSAPPTSPRDVPLPASPSSPSSSPVVRASSPSSPSGPQRLVRSPPLTARASPASLTVCTELGIRAPASASTSFLSTSPTSLTPTPTPHSLTPTPTPKSTTPVAKSETSSSISLEETSSQEFLTSSKVGADPIPIPAPVPSSALQYPLTPVPLLSLSPTTSSTSTCLPATPSDGDTSSYDGHSDGHGTRVGHVRVLSVPLEADEDAFLSEIDSADHHDHQRENTVTARKDKDKARVIGAREFGALVRTVDGDEESESGGLPPLPASISSGSVASKENEERISRSHVGATVLPGQPVVKRKTLNLFGRRRNTDPTSTISPPPMIEIPDRVNVGNAPLQTKRSLTTLRRAVAAVSGNAQPSSNNAKDEPHRHLSPSLHHSATMPVSAGRSSGRTGNSKNERGRFPVSSSTSTNLAPPSASHLRPRAPALSPTMHSRASILMETRAIEDEESRRLSEAAFLDF